MGRRVLFAEDEGALRSIVGELLREEGFDVVEAETGDEAVCVLDNQGFDFLLTDVRMPGSRDGLDLAAYAQRKDPNLAVVVVTGYADQLEARIRSLGERVTLLRKPFRLLEVLAALGGAAERCVPFSVEADLPGGSLVGLQHTDELIGDSIDAESAEGDHLVAG